MRQIQEARKAWEAGNAGTGGEGGNLGEMGVKWVGFGWSGSGICIKDVWWVMMRDGIVEKWRQTVTDVWRTLGGGEKEKYATGERYVITLNKGL